MQPSNNPAPPTPVLEIDENGDIHTLYTDEVNLFAVGRVEQVRRASHVEFDETSQEWQVIDAITRKIVHTNPRRDKAIEWEIKNFAPGGPLYQGDQQ